MRKVLTGLIDSTTTDSSISVSRKKVNGHLSLNPQNFHIRYSPIV